MKRPKFFDSWTERQYAAFKWFFLYPMGIILLGRLIIYLVLILD